MATLNTNNRHLRDVFVCTLQSCHNPVGVVDVATQSLRMFNTAFGALCPDVSVDRRIAEFFTADSVKAFIQLVKSTESAPFENFVFTARDRRRRFSTRGYVAFDCIIIHLVDVTPAAAAPAARADARHPSAAAAAAAAARRHPEPSRAPPLNSTPRRERRRSSQSVSQSVEWAEHVDVLDNFSRREDIVSRMMQDVMHSIHGIDDDERVVAASDHFMHQLGYESSQLSGVKFVDLVAPDDKDRVAAHRSFEREHKKAIPLVVFMRCGNGELIRVMSRMETVANHIKVCTTVPLNDSTHYSEDDITTSSELVKMANSLP